MPVWKPAAVSLALLSACACAGETEVLDAGIERDAQVPPDAGASDAGTASCIEGQSAPAAGPFVTLGRGHVLGLTTTDGVSFLGIPFAEPPIGERRFQRPVEPTACFDGVFEATNFGPKCPQIEEGNYVGDEDCLQLNVWTPSLAGAARPVLFFIHGGGNALGSTTQTAGDVYIYDGGPLAARGDAVVVTANYRIGQLGWLSHASITEAGRSGNYGLFDLLMALRWVKDNIAAFGGDPNRVMIFGESAGAVNTCLLLASPLTEGLFHAALMQSGGCPAYPREDVEVESAAIVDELGCAAAADPAACLRAVDAETLIRTRTPPVSVVGVASRMQPFVDGDFLPTAPLVAIEAGANADVPLIVGANTDETSRSAPNIQTVEQYEAAVRALLPTPSVADRVLAQYPAADYPTPRAAFVRLSTDVKFVCSSRNVLRARVRGGHIAFRYIFSHGLDSGPAAAFGAWHGLELTFVFGHLAIAGYQASEAERVLSGTMQEYWSSFARDGVPDVANAPSWPSYDEALDPYLRFDGDGIVVESGFRTEHCDFWDALLPG